MVGEMLASALQLMVDSFILRISVFGYQENHMKFDNPVDENVYDDEPRDFFRQIRIKPEKLLVLLVAMKVYPLAVEGGDPRSQTTTPP